MKLEFIPLWDVDEHWPEVSKMLEKALAYQTGLSLDSVYSDLKRAKYLLWRIPGRAAIVTEIQPFALEKVCMVILCGGEKVTDWLPVAEETLSRHAKALGCAALVIIGRKGWSGIAPNFEITDFVMRKAL